jgi:Phosphotransferase enzyme family
MTAVRPVDGLSGATFDRVDDRFVKRTSRATDWAMRITGDLVFRPYVAWRAGLLAALPDCLDHTVISMAVSGTGEHAELEIVMRDVGAFLVPPGSEPVPADWHAAFIEHMAALAAAFHGWHDPLCLMTMRERLLSFAPATTAAELSAAPALVPAPLAASAVGWRRLATASPPLSALATLVHRDPSVLTGPMAATPATLLHGDWKMGNLGRRPDGRTILIDWALPGAGPACWDLCWYLSLNRERLPESKEETIARFRAGLQRSGVAIGEWWQRQLDLCLIGIMATFGWDKALGDPDELAWWESTVASAAARQGIDPTRAAA